MESIGKETPESMIWLLDVYRTSPTAHAIAIVAMVCAAGMALGSIRIRGIGLGTAGVLFAGIIVGYLGKPLNHATLEFIKEFGLILFVYCIGLQLGPGFFASLREVGIRLNLLAAAVVGMGALIAAAIGWLLSIDPAAVLGLFSGATTNTPSLGAAQQTLSQFPAVSPERLALPALAYAVTYPAAIVGIIATLLLLSRVFRVDVLQHAEAFAREQLAHVHSLERRTMIVTNSNLEGRTIESVPGSGILSVVISRHRRAGATEATVAGPATVLHVGDHLLAVGTAGELDQYQCIIGQAVSEDLLTVPGTAVSRRVIVSSRKVLGKSLRQLELEKLHGVIVTRVIRTGLDLAAAPHLRLQFGDVLQVVGDEESIEKAATGLGNSLKALNETHFVPLFAGIVAGIVLGTLPLVIPGIPQAVRLGLAGGPLIVALCVGRIGKIGPLVWHMPQNANLAFREFGISLFFAAVGLMAGPRFFAVVFSAQGLVWLVAGICITSLPIFAVGSCALGIWKMNFVTVSGLIAGSMTDPPALAFAGNICRSEAPTVAYASVFPLTTMLRVLAAQVLTLTLCG